MGANQLTKGIWFQFWGDWSACSHQGKAEYSMILAVPNSRDFSTAGQAVEGHSEQWGLVRAVLPDRGFIESEGNVSWALQSSTLSFIPTYCFLRVPLKISGQSAGLETSAIHTCTQPVPVLQYKHCPHSPSSTIYVRDVLSLRAEAITLQTHLQKDYCFHERFPWNTGVREGGMRN